MSSSPRLSLSDCTTTLHFPPPASSATPDEAALHAATTAAPSLTEAHVGSTLLLLLTVTPPATATSPLAPLLTALTNLSVTLGPTASAARRCPLPLLRESSWQPVPCPTATAAAPLCKAFWVLLRAPPQTTHLSATPRLPGPQHLYLRLTHSSAPPARNSPVWATIDRAARLFAKPPVLHVSRPVLINQPLEVACTALSVARAGHPAFISIAARNATQDAVINVLPPYLNLNHSRVVADPALCAPPTKPSGADDPHAVKDPPREIGALGERYEFVPVCPAPDPAEDDDDFSAELSDLANASPTPIGANARYNPTGDDYGLFIPSFSHWQRRAVSLAPRDVFHFVYKVVDKGQAPPEKLQATTAAPGTPPVLRLKHGTCLETSVAVAWNCVPAHTPAAVHAATASAAPPPPPDGENPPDLLQRELSSGGVLATGKRGNVAVRWTCVHWRPPALIDGLVVAFSGPPLCDVADTLSVAVTILNQTGGDLESAAVCVQQDPDVRPLLLALRTVVVVGHVPAGQEATLQIPCIALKAGTLSLGTVRIVDRAKHGSERTVWTSHAAYEVFVVDPHAPVPGDPQTLCSGVSVPETEAKMAPA